MINRMKLCGITRIPDHFAAGNPISTQLLGLRCSSSHGSWKMGLEGMKLENEGLSAFVGAGHRLLALVLRSGR